MRDLFQRIYNLVFIKNYWILLLIVVLISYGQILGMGVWKDDNAIFFKFDHINEQAGFFGTGLLGSGVYKFSITPYYPIYKIFGNESTVPYYALILIFYFISTICVYYLFTKLHSVTLGKIAALLFATGNISSEGFFWLANSMLSHMAILFLSIILIFYHLYYSKKKIYYYLFALFFYWICVSLVPLRTHYFIAIILAFEIIYFAFKKISKSLIYSVVRSIPFVLIFNHYFISGIDPRAISIKDYVISILKGDLYNTFSFFSFLSNMVLSDNYVNVLRTNLPSLEIIIFIFLAIFFFIIFKRSKRRIIFTAISLLLCLFWFFISKNIFGSSITLSKENLFTAFFGGIVLYNIFLFYFLIEKEKRNLYLFLCVWLIVSIAAYAAYQPTAFFETTHRYFTNTFVSEVGILALLYLFFSKKKDLSMRLLRVLIIAWGLSNMISSVSYQNLILRTRSKPVANFYNQLKEYLPRIKKGDILFFDVANNAQKYFDSAFSVSSMPETTAIAWRYGIDRYDLSRFTEYDEFFSYIVKNKPDIDNVYTFFYNSNGLTDTTSQTRNLLLKGSTFKLIDDLEKIDLNSSVPILVNMQIKPQLVNKPEKLLPSPKLNNLNYSIEMKIKIFDYLKSKRRYYSLAKVTSESEWKYREIRNINDNNIETVWQGHRLWWHDNQHEELIIDLGETRYISTVLWKNWIKSLSPTSYNIQVSTNGKYWQKVYEINKALPKEDGQVVLDSFKPVLTRFIKMEITETSAEDSPAITEIEAVGPEFSSLDLEFSHEIENDPYSIVENIDEWNILKYYIKDFAKLLISWTTDKSINNKENVPIVVDSLSHDFEFVLPAGGTKINEMFLDLNIPAEIGSYKLMMRNLSISELEKMGLIKEFKEN